MTIKWSRESFLVTLMTIAILIGVFFYGNRYLIEPVKEEAQVLTETVENQRTLSESYPPNEELLLEFETNYSDTNNFLPNGSEANKELVTLEQIAGDLGIAILSVSRVAAYQAVEGVSGEFVKDTYTTQVISDSSTNLRQLINQLMNQERIWNISSFGYEKAGEDNYSASFNFELAYYNDDPSSVEETVEIEEAFDEVGLTDE